MRVTLLENAREHYKKAKNEVNMVLCEEQKKLLVKQKELEKNLKRDFLELSLQDTVYRLFQMKEVKLAQELCLTFRVPERRYAL